MQFLFASGFVLLVQIFNIYAILDGIVEDDVQESEELSTRYVT